jgi:hypothetical protein
LEAVGVAGVAFTTTFVVPAADGHPLTVTVTEYVPACAVVVLDRVGFCSADVKPFGPVQAYVAPLTVAVESAIVAPSQYGPPLEAVGVAGIGLTTTLVVPAAEGQPLAVTMTEYVPASAVVAFARVGFCSEDVNPFGPVHAYVAPLTVAVESAIVAPAQYGPPFDGVGVAVALTTTFVVPGADIQPLTVILTEYVPASAAVAFVRVGFRTEAVNPFGPVHAYDAPPPAFGVESAIVAPAQYGPVLLAVGVAGWFTTTLVVPAADGQLLTVAVTEYVPASAVVALERVGFCSEDVKPFGPVHAYVAPLTVGVESAIVAPAQ